MPSSSQHPAGLRARVVELARLADDDRTGSDDEDAVDVVALGHQALDSLSEAAVACLDSGFAADLDTPFGLLDPPRLRRVAHHVREPVEEVVGVVRAGRRLRVVLHAERRDVEAVEALDHVVVEVDVAHLDPPEALAGESLTRSMGASTAKPWLCAVISTRPVARSSTGWLMPR